MAQTPWVAQKWNQKMFDTIHQHQIGRVYTTVQVEEKRAPTDASVRLLREMETAAKNEVIKGLALPSNDLKGVVHYIEEPLLGGFKVAVMFKLNGKDHRVDIRLHPFYEDTPQKKAEKISKEVSDYLSRVIIGSIVDSKFIQGAIQR